MCASGHAHCPCSSTWVVLDRELGVFVLVLALVLMLWVLDTSRIDTTS